VDDDRGLGQRRVLEQAVEQGRLAGAEEAGEHGERDRLRRRAPGCARVVPGGHCGVGALFALAFFFAATLPGWEDFAFGFSCALALSADWVSAFAVLACLTRCFFFAAAVAPARH